VKADAPATAVRRIASFIFENWLKGNIIGVIKKRDEIRITKIRLRYI